MRDSVNGQVQHNDGVAAMYRNELLDIVTCFIVGDVIPSVAFANLLIELVIHTMVDGQVEGDN